jgi:hypothetical protein
VIALQKNRGTKHGDHLSEFWILLVAGFDKDGLVPIVAVRVPAFSKRCEAGFRNDIPSQYCSSLSLPWECL